MSALDLNSSNSNANSNSKVSPSPLSTSEKSNHHSEIMNNNGVNSNNHSQYSSHSLNGPEKVLPSPSIDRKEFDFSKVNGEF